MTGAECSPDPEAFVESNREMLVRLLRHSSNPYARACAWTILDAGSDAPDLDRLQRELAALQHGESAVGGG